MDRVWEEERDILQYNLPFIRAVLYWRQEDLSHILDVSRTTMSKIESKGYKLTNVQYYALMWIVQTEMDQLSDVGCEEEERAVGLLTSMLRYKVQKMTPEYLVTFHSRN